MDRNISIILLVSAIAGTAEGLFQFIFSLYLLDLNVSFANMGIIFSISAIVMAFFGVIWGWLSDLFGRKRFYGLSLFLASLASLLSLIMHRLWELALVKITDDVAMSVRNSMHPTLIYDYAKERFTRLWARTRGLWSVSSAAGRAVAGLLLVLVGFDGAFLFCGIIFLCVSFVFELIYREVKTSKKTLSRRPSILDLRGVFSFDVSRNLKTIALSLFIFRIGVGISHSFIMNLFFILKFGVTSNVAAIVSSIHSLSGGVGLIIGASFIRKKLRLIGICSLLFEGTMIALAGVTPFFFLSAFLWLLHDLLGMALWQPAQQTLIQRNGNESTRGRDTNIVLAIGSMGTIFGPLLTGALLSIDTSLPFVVSGVIIIVSSILWLPIKEK